MLFCLNYNSDLVLCYLWANKLFCFALVVPMFYLVLKLKNKIVSNTSITLGTLINVRAQISIRVGKYSPSQNNKIDHNIHEIVIARTPVNIF